VRTRITMGAGKNGHGRRQLGHEPHTAPERVESLDTDVRAQTEFGHEREMRARI
jgi:hypothetical protein